MSLNPCVVTWRCENFPNLQSAHILFTNCCHGDTITHMSLWEERLIHITHNTAVSSSCLLLGCASLRSFHGGWNQSYLNLKKIMYIKKKTWLPYYSGSFTEWGVGWGGQQLWRTRTAAAVKNKVSKVVETDGHAAWCTLWIHKHLREQKLYDSRKRGNSYSALLCLKSSGCCDLFWVFWNKLPCFYCRICPLLTLLVSWFGV